MIVGNIWNSHNRMETKFICILKKGDYMSSSQICTRTWVQTFVTVNMARAEGSLNISDIVYLFMHAHANQFSLSDIEFWKDVLIFIVRSLTHHFIKCQAFTNLYMIKNVIIIQPHNNLCPINLCCIFRLSCMCYFSDLIFSHVECHSISNQRVTRLYLVYSH
jgi:hypothetical protein